MIKQFYMNCVENKKVFVNYRIFEGLFDKVYSNYKKRDYDI